MNTDEFKNHYCFGNEQEQFKESYLEFNNFRILYVETLETTKEINSNVSEGVSAKKNIKDNSKWNNVRDFIGNSKCISQKVEEFL